MSDRWLIWLSHLLSGRDRTRWAFFFIIFFSVVPSSVEFCDMCRMLWLKVWNKEKWECFQNFNTNKRKTLLTFMCLLALYPELLVIVRSSIFPFLVYFVFDSWQSKHLTRNPFPSFLSPMNWKYFDGNLILVSFQLLDFWTLEVEDEFSSLVRIIYLRYT